MNLEQIGQGPPPFFPYSYVVKLKSNTHFEKRVSIEESEVTAISASNGINDFGKRNRTETRHDARKPNDVALGIHSSLAIDQRLSNSLRELFSRTGSPSGITAGTVSCECVFSL